MNNQPADYQMLSFTTRRIVAWTFVILFFCTAPLLVLYTAGYGYNFKKQVIQKTGSLSIKPTPSSAQIYLDGKLQTASRPDNTLRINNLLPGEYTVRISQDGYYDWQKKLVVSESTNTFVNQVVLFKNDNQLRQIAADLQTWFKTTKNIVYTTTDGKIFVATLSTGQTQNVGPLEATEKINSFSLDGGRFISADTKGNYFLYDLDKPNQKLSINQLSDKNLSRLSWSPTVDYHLVGWSGQALYQINTITKEVRLLTTLPSNLSVQSNVHVAGTMIYFVASNKKTALTSLYSLDSKDSTGPRAILKLKTATDYTFKKTPTGAMTLLSPSQEIVWFFNNDLSAIDFVVTAKDYHWLNISSLPQLLLTSDFAVQIVNLDQSGLETILRISQQIDNVQPIGQTNYFAYQAQGRLNIIEHDGRDQRNLIELSNIGQITDFVISPDGQKLYIIKNTGQASSLEQSIIQDPN